LLAKDIAGYAEYKKKVNHHLNTFVWLGGPPRVPIAHHHSMGIRIDELSIKGGKPTFPDGIGWKMRWV
jgi:hypothetical protein